MSDKKQDEGREAISEGAPTVTHLKKTHRGEIWCGVDPHGIRSTMSERQASCRECLDRLETQQDLDEENQRKADEAKG